MSFTELDATVAAPAEALTAAFRQAHDAVRSAMVAAVESTRPALLTMIARTSVIVP